MANTTLSEQFSLRWNNFSSNLTSGFLNHLTENDLVDVTFAVDGQLLQAHKLVLSVCSPYFKNIFKENPCQHPVIILKDIKYNEIESLLKFMYQGEINIKKEDLSTFLKVAQTLQIRGLATDDASATKLFSNCDNQSNADSGTQNVAQSYLSNIRDTSKNVKMMDRRKRSRDITKKSAKRKKQDASTLLETSYDLLNVNADNDNQEVLLLLDKGMNESRENVSIVEGNDNVKMGGNDNVKTKDNDNVKTEDNDNVKTEDNDNIKTKDNDNVKTEDFSEQASAQTSRENPGQQVRYGNGDNNITADEPVIYRLSARGRPQLVYKGYVYNLTSRSEGLNRSHYRCAEQHRGCKGKCAVIAERFMPTDVRNHNHPPGYQSEHNYRKKKGFDIDAP